MMTTKFNKNGMKWTLAVVVAMGLALCLTNPVFAQTGEIYGWIYTDDTDEPLPESVVYVLDWEGLLVDSTLAEADGYYSITGLPTYEELFIGVDPPANQMDAYLAEFYDGRPDFELADVIRLDILNPSINLDFYLDPIGGGTSNNGIISGKVLDENGNPVEYVLVSAWSETHSSGNGAQTDANGFYQIEGLVEAGVDDGYVVEVWPLEYASQTYGELVATGRTDVNFTLSKGATATLSGILQDETGAPLAGVMLEAWSYFSNAWGVGETDTNGQFAIADLPVEEDYILTAYAPNGVIHYNGALFEEDADFIYLAGDTDIGVFSIGGTSQTGPKIQGRVTVNGASPGELIWVEACSDEAMFCDMAMTDMEGNFSIPGLDSGVSDWIVVFYPTLSAPVYYGEDDAGNPKAVYSYNQAVGIAASETETIYIDIPVEGGEIAGTVKLNDELYPGAWVEAWSQDAGYWDSTETTSDEPNYRLQGLPAGLYEVTVHPSEVLFFESPLETNHSFIPVTKNIQVGASGIATLNFNIEPAPLRTISGTVSGLSDNETAWITAWSPSSGAYGETEFVSGDDGYILSGLAPVSDYIVECFSENGSHQVYNLKDEFDDPDFVDVSTEDRLDVNFDLSELTPSQDMGSIAGTIVFPEGTLGGTTALVEAFSESTGFMGETLVILEPGAESADYVISSLPPADDYVVSVWPENYAPVFSGNAVGYEDAQWTQVTGAEKTTIDDINLQGDAAAAISGRITENGAGIAGVFVHVWSESSGAWGEAITDDNGDYIINGLVDAADYIVEIWSVDMGTFYYAEAGPVQSILRADPIDTGAHTGIDLDLTSAGWIIQGQVLDSDNKPLTDIQVSAWSDTLMAGNGDFTDRTGNFKIKGLPEGQNYTVSVLPDWDALWLSSQKTGVSTCNPSSNCVDIVFTLNKKGDSYTLEGTVRSEAGDPLKDVLVEVESTSLGDYGGYGWAMTDATGNFSIPGLLAGNDYIIRAWPEPDTGLSYASLTDVVLPLQTPLVITIGNGRNLKGVVTLPDGSPAKNAWVVVYSATDLYWEEAQTNKTGAYSITNLPSDWTNLFVFASLEGYLESETSLAGKASPVDLSLSQGGSISGVVTAQGKALADAAVVVQRKNQDGNVVFWASARTKNGGEYQVTGLPVSAAYGEAIADYEVTASADGYPEQVETGKSAGDIVNFSLIRQSGTDISGVVELSAPELEDIYAAVNVFDKNDQYVDYCLTDEAGNFSCNALESGAYYRLLIGAYYRNPIDPNQTEKYLQWAGDPDGDGNSTGVVNQTDPYLPPVEATLYQPGDKVLFSFDLTVVKKRSIMDIAKMSVRNLRSASHATVAGLSRTSSEKVSGNPNVTIKWDPAVDAEKERYFYEFNAEPDHRITKRNAKKPGISARKATSHALAGDGKAYYAHVAAEDERGRIMGTAHLEFVIDTMAPKNPRIETGATAPGRSGRVKLKLGAENATEMYISNVNYGQGGKWEKYADEKEWQLPTNNESGLDTVYVQFRDEANNIAQASITLKRTTPTASPLKNAVVALKILSGVSTGVTQAQYADADGVTQGGAIRITMADALFYLQKAAGLR